MSLISRDLRPFATSHARSTRQGWRAHEPDGFRLASLSFCPSDHFSRCLPSCCLPFCYFLSCFLLPCCHLTCCLPSCHPCCLPQAKAHSFFSLLARLFRMTL